MKKMLPFVALILMGCFQIIYAQYSWIPKANFSPGNRNGAFSFSIGSLGYVGGGIYQSGSNLIYINDFWEYNPASDTWTQKAYIPGNAFSSCAAFSIDQYGYVTTGYTGGIYLNQTLRYDPVANQWTTVANFPGAARYTTASFVINNEAYVGMGKSGGYYSDFYKYNPINNAWTSVAAIPGPARQSAKGFSINGYGYVVGGANGSGDYATLYQYDPLLNSWSQKLSYPGLGRYALAAFTLNNTGIVGTGAIQTSSNNTFSDFYSYDPVNNLWSPFLSFAGGIRNSTSFCAIGNNAYMGLGTAGVYPVVNYQQDWWELIDATGINDVSSAIPVNVTVHESIIKFNFDSQLKSKTDIEIFDLAGKEVFHQLFSEVNNTLEIDFADHAKGVYLYSIHSKRQSISGKLIIY